MSHIELLKTNDLKATPQRLCVLDILKECGHATLDEIQTITKEKFPTLSVSTIYRNLNEMIEKGIVSEVKITKKQHFEITKEKHLHLYCKECGKLQDFHFDTHEFTNSVEKLAHCLVINDIVNLEIICEECLKKNNK
jgi:Fur family transcriptional regulator, peroxide stress response regulator